MLRMFGNVYLDKLTTEQAESSLVENLSAQDMAEFIVDVINRGWIDRHHMGISENGEPI